MTRVEYESLNDLLEDRGLIDDEGTRVELKRAKNGLPQTFWQSVTAFLNTIGGYILLGFEDGTKEPVPDLAIDELQKNIASGVAQRLDPAISPTVEVVKVAGCKVIVVTVRQADIHQKPVHYKDKNGAPKALKRVGASNLQMTREDIERILLEKSGRSPDGHILSGYTLDQLDKQTLARYRQRLQNLRPTDTALSKDDGGLLASVGCVSYSPETRNWVLNRAGLLVFGQEDFIRSEFPALEVQILKFDEPDWKLTNENRGKKTVIDGKALFDLIPELEETLRLLFPPTVKVTPGKFGREPDPIYKALREAIINAVVHQDYLARRYIQIRIFTDRLEIENPGYSRKPVELFNKPGSDPRNPNIAKAFEKIEYVEKQGFGGAIMIDSIEEAGFTPPEFLSDIDKNSFTVTFHWQHFMSQADLDWVSEFGEMPEDDRKALVYAKNNKDMKNADVRRLCGHDTLKASRVLQRLKSRQLLELHGTGKQAYYTLNARPVSRSSSPKPSRQVGLFEGDGLEDVAGQIVDVAAKSVDAPGKSVDAPAETVDASRKTVDAQLRSMDAIKEEVQQAIQGSKLPRKARRELIENAILEATQTFRTIAELAEMTSLAPERLRAGYVQKMTQSGLLEMKYPEKPKHPDQAYRARKP